MIRRTVVVAEVVGSVGLLVLTVFCWQAGVQVTHFGPVREDGPAFDSTYYSGPWIIAASVSVALAGVLVIDLVRRLRTSSETRPGVPAGGTVER
ncbi:hypothetical protein OG921_01000 [Aldersonia sp. NBC_00410]|uniref:hypothetical protein n=1 Tax=Aldersonia sp. NBC_00410 TaxID=2975954 RepID=UPI002250AE43|nr:hypothetical protein [Aldersonia sp. NBC_00410]MCX5041768.1 hypothetical protein [Aldersonia sp. NBC_00410]